MYFLKTNEYIYFNGVLFYSDLRKEILNAKKMFQLYLKRSSVYEQGNFIFENLILESSFSNSVESCCFLMVFKFKD